METCKTQVGIMLLRQNLKQKIVNLLKKFKATEEGHRGSETKPGGAIDNIDNIDELFDELEGLSDSEPDADTLSVGSFPKPVLPPFFASSRSLAQYSKCTSVQQVEYLSLKKRNLTCS